MKNLVTKINKKHSFIKNILLNFSVFLLSLYTGLLLLPLIKLNYSNPYEIVGLLSASEYNPNNNFLKYIFMLAFVPLLFFLIKSLIHQKKLILVRIIFISIICLFFFISNTSIYLTKAHNIDMFHDGEQLGVGSALYLFNKEPYKDTFFLHGAFTDPVIAFISFKIFGYSVGSFYLLLSLLNLFTILLLMFLLIITLKNEVMFYMSAVFFWGSLYTGVIYRDLTSFLFIILVYFIEKRKIKQNFGILLTSFLSFITFYISMDRGYYLFVANSFLFFLILLSFFIKKTQLLKTLPKKIFFTLKKNIELIMSYILGNSTAIIFGLIFLGWSGFKNFLLITFVQINKMKPFLDERIYPEFNLSSLFPFWIPIIITIIMIICLIYFIKLNKKNYIFLSILVLMSIIYFRNALGRSDLHHVLYISHFIFLSAFVLIDFFIKQKLVFIQKLAFVFAFLLFFTGFFNKNKIIDIPNYHRSDIKIFFKLYTLNDDFWLNQEQIDVSSFIKNNTTQEDYVFVFTNEAAYYYLFSRKSPTRFYTIWFAAANFFQKEAVNDLEKNKPKYIIYRSNYWSNNIDFISNKEKLKKIDAWILDKYQLFTTINSTEIYALK